MSKKYQERMKGTRYEKKNWIFSSSVIRTLGLDIPAGTPIYVADSNIEHMKTSHPEDYENMEVSYKILLLIPIM